MSLKPAIDFAVDPPTLHATLNATSIATPRAVTGAVARRAWTEPRVRFWWLFALLLLLVATYFGLSQYAKWAKDTALIKEGQLIMATVTSANGISVISQKMPPESPVFLQFDWKGKPHELSGFLAGRSEYIEIGSEIPLRIDANDPDRWTARTEPTALGREMIGLLVPIVAALPLILMSLLKQRSALHAWRTGAVTSATVIDTRQPAVAPRSLAVRCAPDSAGGQPQRVITVYLPRRAGRPEKGDAIDLLVPPGDRTHRAVAAGWFT